MTRRKRRRSGRSAKAKRGGGESKQPGRKPEAPRPDAPVSNEPRTRKASGHDFVPFPPPLFVVGILCALVALLASGMMVLSHFAHLDLPGCGPDSPCADAQASVFGKIPGLQWPVSHMGFAWFLGLLTAWVSFAWHGLSARFRGLVRIGAAGSLAFLVIMVVNRYLCVYCLTTHLANFGLLACLELRWLRWRKPRAIKADTAVALAVAALVTVILVPFEVVQTHAAEEKAQREVDSSVVDVIAASDIDPNTFVGRYVKGPKRAALRMVFFSDFQCKICKTVKDELHKIMAGRSDIAVSVKHFPLCTDCNVYLARVGPNMHPNACRAARAAEAAGILNGDKGFFEMHDLLFEKYGGNFTDGQLRKDLVRLRYDPSEFFKVMNGKETLRRVKADIDEGRALGLRYTPMVFINGVEVKGVRQPGMLTRAVRKITAANPPALAWGEAGDVPADADRKIIEDWKSSPLVTLPADHVRWWLGEQEDANIVADIVLFGDYQEPNTRQADSIIRARLATQPGIRYTYRHCPFDQQCNPRISRTFHPQACLAARAAEAAGALGGADMFWRMHTWLWPNHQRFTLENFKKVSQGFGLDPEQFQEALTSSQVESALQEDVQASAKLQIRSIPTIYINGRLVPRWKLQDDEKLSRVLDEVLGPTPKAASNP